MKKCLMFAACCGLLQIDLFAYEYKGFQGPSNAYSQPQNQNVGACVIDRGLPVKDNGGKAVGYIGGHGEVIGSAKESIGRVDCNGNFIPDQQLINGKVLETVGEYRSNNGACHIGENGIEVSIGAYKDGYSNITLSERVSGEHSSVKFSQSQFSGDSQLVAYIHNHPGEGENPWPSVADVKSAIRSGKDVYVVDCADGGAVLRINHDTGAVSRILPGGTEQPTSWEDFRGPNGNRIYENNYEKQSRVKDASKLADNDLYDPSRFKDIAQAAFELQDKGKIDFSKVDNDVGDVKIPDLSNLISILKQMIEYLRRINAMGQKPSDEELVGYNRLLSSAQEELKRIITAMEVKIEQMSTSKQEQRRIAEELGKQMAERIEPYCDTIESLQRQIEAKGYGHFGHVGFNPKHLK